MMSDRRNLVAFGRCTALAASLVLAPLRGSAQETAAENPPAASPVEISYRPTPLADRIILTWTGDPTTSQAVTWRTSTEITTACAQIAVAEADPDFTAKAATVAATTQPLASEHYTAHCHTVEFAGLMPATRYAYRVGDGVNWSEWFHFSTASAEPEAFSFVYFGDAQTNLRSLWSRVIREAYRDAPKARFLVHAGDLINRAEADAEWGEWFAAGGWLNAMVPNVPVPGNHEQAKNEDGSRRLTRHWRPQFALPLNGPEGLEESCYTLVYQNLRLIALNSNTELEKQTEWLEQVLEANESPWVICTFHHPIYSTARNRDNPAIRAAWKPLFDRFRVDLVLQGHDHTYGRTGLATPQTLPETLGNAPTGVTNIDTQTGTVYVVSVSGPKMYDVAPHPFMPRIAEDTQLYQIIHIDGDTLRYEARTAIGELYDAFALKKHPGKINELVEVMPEVSERGRSE